MAAKFSGEAIDKFNRLSRRERGITLVALCAIVGMVWVLLVYDPYAAETARFSEMITNNRQETIQLADQLGVAQRALSEDPNAGYHAELKDLQVKLTGMDKQLEGIIADLINPRLMPQVLKRLLKSESQLRLLKLKSLLPVSVDEILGKEKVLAKPGDTLPEPPAGDHTILFRHGILLQFEGSYFETIRYLESIEGLPWKFFWGDLDYRVLVYPNAEVTLRLYMLSNERAWIGV